MEEPTSPADPMTQIMEAMRQMSAQITAQNQRLIAIEATSKSLPAENAPVVTSDSSKNEGPKAEKRPKERLPLLREFGGKRADWEEWHLAATLKIRADGKAIGGEGDHFDYLVSRLTGDAAKATHAFALEKIKDGTGSSESLISYLSRLYDDPNREARAIQALHDMRQGDNEAFGPFITKFETTLANAGGGRYDDGQRIAYLRNALNYELRNRLIGNKPPSDWSSYVAFLQTIDSELQALQIGRRHAPPTAAAKKTTLGDITTAEPMDWEPTAPITSNQMVVRNGRHAKWVSEATITFRKQRGLCLRCGHQGHMIRDCPFLPAARTTQAKVMESKTIELADAEPEPLKG